MLPLLVRDKYAQCVGMVVCVVNILSLHGRRKILRLYRLAR